MLFPPLCRVWPDTTAQLVNFETVPEPPISKGQDLVEVASQGRAASRLGQRGLRLEPEICSWKVSNIEQMQFLLSA